MEKEYPMATTVFVSREWARTRGPELLRILKVRELDAQEHEELEAIKANCECLDKPTPSDLVHNGENCELCGSFVH